MKAKTILGLERNVFFTGLTSFLTDTTTKMIYAVMPLFLISIGATKTELSLIEGIAESTASVLKALAGWWSDKIGKNKPFMILGYAMTALLTPLFAFAISPLQVLFIRFAERVGKGIRTAPRDSLIASSSAAGKLGRSFGFHKAMDNSGAIIGPLLAFAVLAIFPEDYRKVFIISGIPAILGVLVILFFIKEVHKLKSELPGKIRLKDFPRRYYFFLSIAFIFTLGNSTDALLLVKASDVGIAAAFIPLVYMVFNGVSVLLSVPAGMLSDRIGREKLILLGYFVYTLVYFGFGRAQSPIMIIILFACYGIYSAAADGAQKALVADLSPKGKRGTSLGLYNAIIGFTLLPASILGGVLYDKLGNGAPFYFGAAMGSMATIMMLVFLLTGAKKPNTNTN